MNTYASFATILAALSASYARFHFRPRYALRIGRLLLSISITPHARPRPRRHDRASLNPPGTLAGNRVRDLLNEPLGAGASIREVLLRSRSDRRL